MEFILKNGNKCKIKVGDIITVQAIDDEDDIFDDEVISTENIDCDDYVFQVRTKNLGYDFTNFFSIIKINSIEVED